MSGAVEPEPARLRLCVRGAVQGVGFRPFIYRLATELGLRGWVNNSAQGVFIEVEGTRSLLSQFLFRIEAEKPPRSFIQSLESTWLDPIGYVAFEIRESDSSGEIQALVLPDIATCPECLREVFDPANRRYQYPFTNCTNCGPRFSIIEALPYDRPKTSMKHFQMCPDCQAEYDNPLDRRFHAQPNACPTCGPHLELWNREGKALACERTALLEAAKAIRSGSVVAVKGLGGFHLMVAAQDDAAVRRLRELKHREEKPFALMFPSLAEVKEACAVNEFEERLLRSPEAPIVLLRRNNASHRPLAHSIAPGNPNLGVMLPYTPLHHLLLMQVGMPVVATSGNLSDEPICIDEREALRRLGGMAELFLVHNRPIVRHVDDSIMRVMLGREMVLRRARGYAPLPVTLKEPVAPTLAVGAHLKNSVALGIGRQAFISQHIGDLETAEALGAFRRVIRDFQQLYQATPTLVAADAHPEYLSTKFAYESALPVLSVQHHYAHIFACMAENDLDPPVLGVSWDGTGYGLDGTVWGGEFVLVTQDAVKRIGHLRTFRLPGGDTAIREPRRVALGLLYELLGDSLFENWSGGGSPPSSVPDKGQGPSLHKSEPETNSGSQQAGSLRYSRLEVCATLAAFSLAELGTLRTMLKRGLNAPVTSSAGRLFDTVASIIGLRQLVRFEGQAAMELEFAAETSNCSEAYQFELRPGPSSSNAPFIADWAPVVNQILVDLDRGGDSLSPMESAGAVNSGTSCPRSTALADIAAKFHNALANLIVAVAQRAGEAKVVLSGGCFQNKYLTEHGVQALQRAGFRPYWHQRVPPNDGGIALGQIVAASRKCH